MLVLLAVGAKVKVEELEVVEGLMAFLEDSEMALNVHSCSCDNLKMKE